MCFIQIGAPEQIERSVQRAGGDTGSETDCGIQVGAPELERGITHSSSVKTSDWPGCLLQAVEAST
jgi:hypothetical protein